MTIVPSNYTLDIIGYYGPLLLALYSIFILLNQSQYLYGYLFFFFVNLSINQLIKLFLKQPRPDGGINMPTEATNYADVYGMPSGHAQSVSYSLAYLYNIKRTNLVLLIGVISYIFTSFQRWNYRKHTIQQIIIGTTIGLISGFYSYKIVKHFIENKNILRDNNV
jgi:membrane-associated phospholipid phosphatase